MAAPKAKSTKNSESSELSIVTPSSPIVSRPDTQTSQSDSHNLINNSTQISDMPSSQNSTKVDLISGNDMSSNSDSFSSTPNSRSEAQEIVMPVEQEELEPEMPLDRQTSRWIVIIVVLILLVLSMAGAVVYYVTQFGIFSSPNNYISPAPDTPITQPVQEVNIDESTRRLEDQSDSIEIDSIIQDLDDTNLNNLDIELEALEAEM